MSDCTIEQLKQQALNEVGSCLSTKKYTEASSALSVYLGLAALDRFRTPSKPAGLESGQALEATKEPK